MRKFKFRKLIQQAILVLIPAIIITIFVGAVMSGIRKPISEEMYIPDGWDISLQNGNNDWDELFQSVMGNETLDFQDIRDALNSGKRAVNYQMHITGSQQAEITITFSPYIFGECPPDQEMVSPNFQLQFLEAEVYEGGGGGCAPVDPYEEVLSTIQQAIWDVVDFSPSQGLCYRSTIEEAEAFIAETDEIFPENDFALAVKFHDGEYHSFCITSEEYLGTQHQIYFTVSEEDGFSVIDIETVFLEEMNLTGAFNSLIETAESYTQ